MQSGSRLILTPDAEVDAAFAYSWYEEQRRGLGVEFFEEVSASLDAIQFGPLRFPIAHEGIRRALVHRFPYGVFFVTNSDELVLIAVMHLARDPRRPLERSRSHR